MGWDGTVQVREVSVIKGAKVPIVKFVHASSGIHVDVCFNQESGLTSGEAAKAMMRQMQPVRCHFVWVF